ncbi:hypothetical protein QWY79_12835 [Halomonas sabkhae]|uniref:hypothetical protein n=1 Tax=Halomonas sabkhae TaxID=626223 RepID=UPI0025B56AD0|nr:hypothetical protein [Halomonas sabkhae]MDN3526151.1 hypothetical protein [Halomonas sabkhae]
MVLDEPDNIKVFKSCAAVILDILYQSFPNPVDLDILYLEPERRTRQLKNFDDEMKSWDAGHTVDENPVKPHLEIYRNSIYYMIAEEIITCNETKHGESQRTFYACRLTSKGLRVLGRSYLKEKESIGTKLHAALKDGKYKVVQDLVKQLIF